jgi:hypothetical protein
MNRFRHATLLFAFIVALVPALSLRAAGQVDAGIAPYLDDETFLVVRLDVEKVDQEAMAKYAEDAFDKMAKSFPIPADQQGAVKGQMMGGITTARAFLTDIAKAGGKKIYVLMDMSDVGAGVEEPIIIVPLEAGAEAEGVIEVLKRNNGEPENIEEVGKGVVFAPSEARNRLKNRVGAAAPAELPNLAKALSAAGDAPLRVAFAPTEKARSWMQDNLPQLPEELGGIETKALGEGVEYASIAVMQKPKVLANFAVKCKDAEKAKQLMDVASKSLETAKEKIGKGEKGDVARKELDKLKPKLAGDTLSLSIDPVQIQMSMMGIRMEAHAEVDNSDGKATTEKKKDDGGL